MNCRRVNLLMGVYDELDRGERWMVDAHLRNCVACQRAWDDELRTRELIRRIRDREPTVGLDERLRAIALTAPPPPGGAVTIGRLVTRFSLLLAVAAAAVWLVGPGAWDRLQPERGMTDAGRIAQVAATGFTAASESRMGAVDTDGGRGGSERQGSSPGVIERRGEVGLTTAEPVSGPYAETLGAKFSAADPGLASRVALALPGQRALRPPEPQEASAAAVPAAPDDPVGRGGRSGSGERPPEPPRTGRGQATDSPPASPTPLACTVLTAEVFADVAGEGALADCLGCDGAWTPEDEVRAAALGVVLPGGMQITVYDATGEALVEENVGDPRVPMFPSAVAHVALREVCGVWPLTVQLVNVPAAWAACPATGTLAYVLTEPGQSQLGFALTRGCPVLSPTATLPATPTETATLPPIGVGEATPTPLPTAAAVGMTSTPLTPVETQGVPAATPSHPQRPTDAPPPELNTATAPPSPSPVSVAPIRLRPSPTPTPTRRPPRDRPEPGVPKATEPPIAPPWPTPTPTQEGEPKPGVDGLP